MNASSIVEDLLRQVARDLPPSWCDLQSAQATNTAREELAWSLLLHVLSHLLFRDPLPRTVHVGREHVPFTLEDEHWHDFETEIGLQLDGARRQFVDCLASVMRRDPVRLAEEPGLPRLAAGLVHLLNGFSRTGRGSRRLSPRQGSLGFDSAPPDRNNAAALVDDLMIWAGNAGTTPEDRYRIAFHVLWRPLSRRSWSDAVAQADSSPSKLSIPLDFLVQARKEQEPASERALATRTAAREVAAYSARSRMTESEMSTGVHAQDVLAVLIEPLLLLRGDPAASVAAAEETANGFAKDMLRTWRRLLLTDDIKFFGEPGSLIEIKLPDRAWQLAKVPFRRGAPDRPQWVRVVRRGVLLKEEILLPGIVVIEGRPGGDTP